MPINLLIKTSRDWPNKFARWARHPRAFFFLPSRIGRPPWSTAFFFSRSSPRRILKTSTVRQPTSIITFLGEYVGFRAHLGSQLESVILTPFTENGPRSPPVSTLAYPSLLVLASFLTTSGTTLGVTHLADRRDLRAPASCGDDDSFLPPARITYGGRRRTSWISSSPGEPLIQFLFAHALCSLAHNQLVMTSIVRSHVLAYLFFVLAGFVCLSYILQNVRDSHVVCCIYEQPPIYWISTDLGHFNLDDRQSSSPSLTFVSRREHALSVLKKG